MIDLNSKVNIILPVYAKKLGLQIRKPNVDIYKIDRSALETFEIEIAKFQVKNKLRRDCCFQQIFLVANTSIKVVLGMPSFTFSNANVSFANKELNQRIYTSDKTLSTTKRVQIIKLKKFAKAKLHLNKKAFVVYVATIASKMAIYPACKAQITSLKAKKASVTILVEYLAFANVFSEKFATMLSKHTKINIHAINFGEGKLLHYGPIYNLDLVELKTLKI